ncbi:cobalamin biosynthesis protein, partial [Pseudomonas syringae]
MSTCIKPDPATLQPGAALVAGLGCRRGCSAALLRDLLEQSLQALELDIGRVTALASIDLKQTEPGLLELAGQLAVPLVCFN